MSKVEQLQDMNNLKSILVNLNVVKEVDSYSKAAVLQVIDLMAKDKEGYVVSSSNHIASFLPLLSQRSILYYMREFEDKGLIKIKTAPYRRSKFCLTKKYYNLINNK